MADMASRWLKSRKGGTKRSRRRQSKAERQEPVYVDYKHYLSGKKWAKTRQKIMARDHWQCVYCHAPAVMVHHVRYPKKMGDEDARMLQSVCRRCHKLAHGGVPDPPIVVVFIPGEIGVAVLDDILGMR